MSLARTAVRGAIWTIGSSIGARIIGLLGTVVVTRYISPDIMGEVVAATVVCISGYVISHFGFGQYIVVHAKAGRGPRFHASFYNWIFGGISFGLLLAFGDRFGPLVNAPHLAEYVPGMAVALGIRRFTFVPVRTLESQMRFRAVALAQVFGEVTYLIVTVTLARRGWGGQAVVTANIVQQIVMATTVIAAANWRDWLVPVRITWEGTKDVFRFGIPIGIEGVANMGAKYWDKGLISRYFGAGEMGMYNLGYSLADIPATQVGEQLVGVLLPSMANVEPQRRPQVIVRSSALLGLLIFPLALGLGAVADSLIEVALPANWQGVAPLLTALSFISVFRPVSWVIGSYMQVQRRTAELMFFEFAKLGALLGGIALLAPYGSLWACLAIGIAFGSHALGLIIAVVIRDRIPVASMVRGFFGPLGACVPMVAAVFGVRYGLHAVGVHLPLLSLILEILAGAAVYIPAAFLLAPATARDFIGLVKEALSRD